ncbi:MAG: hypothetical protein MUC31_09175 [Bacteroidales bacterium]|nr:hypothetical protein [Bacteroidales bacterium]
MKIRNLKILRNWLIFIIIVPMLMPVYMRAQSDEDCLTCHDDPSLSSTKGSMGRPSG